MSGTFPDTPVTLLSKLAARVTGRADEFAWARFFELYEPAIVKFAEYQGAGAEAEDVAQEILLKLVGFLRTGSFNADAGKFRSYLATLIRREVIGHWRKRQARPEADGVSLDDEKAGVEPAVESETAAILDAKWRLARHAAAVERVLTRTALRQQVKDIYRAHVVEERSADAVARQFGVSADGVYQIKARVGKMVAALEREMGECETPC